MIGRPYVRRRLGASPMEFPKEFDAATMSEMYDEAMDKDNPWHEEARHAYSVIADIVLFERPIRVIFAHLGLSTNLSAGTMGEPNIVDERAFLLQDALGDVWMKNAQACFQPPYSRSELMKHYYLDAWRAWYTTGDPRVSGARQALIAKG